MLNLVVAGLLSAVLNATVSSTSDATLPSQYR